MPRLAKIAIVLVLPLVGALFLFHGEISRFLFHPDGLSLAPAELCVENRAGEVLVARIAVSGGETSTMLIEDGEVSCSASPEAGRAGKIQIARSERAPVRCELEAAAGAKMVIERFDPPHGCGWSE